MPEPPAPERRRVLVGTTEIVGQVHHLAEGFRALGHEVTTVVDRENRFYAARQYDIVFATGGGPLGRLRSFVSRLFRLPRLIKDHDLFVFVFGATLLPRSLDVPLLRLLGKDMVFVFLGSDVRHWEATEQHRREVGLASYAGYRDRSPGRAVRSLRIAELFGDVVYLQPSFAEAAIAPYLHAYLALDPSAFTFEVQTREVPLVVHAPSRRSLKGTEEILAALEQLREQGVRFDLSLLENLPNDEVLAVLADADVIVDELKEAHYGMLALEGVASGCVVLAGNRPDIVPLPKERPIVHISPENLAATLREILCDQDLRRRIALDGDGFVREHHDRVAVAARVLSDLDRARRGDHDYVPLFFTEHYQPVDVRAGLLEKVLTRLVARRREVSEDALRSLRRRALCI